MKSTSFSDKKLFKKSTGLGFLVVIVTVLTLEATSIIQYIFSQKIIREEATSRAESELEVTRLQILDVVDQAEAAVRNSVWIARWCLDVPDSLHVVARRIVQNNPVVVGSTVALVPNYVSQHPLFAPYACREGDRVIIKSLATAEYDYPSQEWFTKPIELDEGYWSEPYIDEGGGEILMTTYSLPIKDSNGHTAAVVTADVSLEWLNEMVGDAQVYPNSFGIILSRAGKIMVSPVETLTMQSTAQDYGRQVDDRELYEGLVSSMLAGQSGNIEFRQKGRVSHVFFGPMERTGWSMSIVIPDDEIFGDIRRIGILVKILQILGVIMLIFILRAVVKTLTKYKEVKDSKERMEDELQIGRNIQMSMIPNSFPPFPDRKDLDVSACLVPAKEVSGDLYDFYIRDEKLYFCIGDVSGKGVPAALVMAVTRSLFRTVSAHEDSPQRIVTAINDSMSETNDNNMFVTFFCGILDLTTGNLRYCNAGHNPPLIFTNKIEKLPVNPNLMLGILPGNTFVEQEINLNYDDALLLYTDGITEAENIEHEQFGEDRLEAMLHTRRDAQGHMDAVRKSVTEFVGEAPQSDDITMLFIHYLNQNLTHIEKRHITLHNDIQQIRQLAVFVDTIAEEKKLDPKTTMNLNLALEEAVTNVILYAYPKDTVGTLDVDAELSDDKLTFTISDMGKAFDPTAAPEADITAPAELRPIGGLGIHLVRNIMDAVSYQRKNNKNILTMVKKL